MNAFQALAQLASDEHWCWNIYCTTCGHLHFRYAFVELAKGKSPEDKDWTVHRRKTRYPRLGEIPRSYSAEQKKNILEICADADLAAISTRCRFPDWLGYLGLVLDHMFMESETYTTLSKAWASQLQGMTSKNEGIHSRLGLLASQGNERLTLEDLKECENSIRRGKMHTKGLHLP